MVWVNEEVVDNLWLLFHSLPDQPLLLQIAKSELDSLFVLMRLQSIQVRCHQPLICAFLVANDLEDALGWLNEGVEGGNPWWLRDWLEESVFVVAFRPRLVASRAKWRIFSDSRGALSEEIVVLVEDIDRHLRLLLAVEGHGTEGSLGWLELGLLLWDALAAGGRLAVIAGGLLEQTRDGLDRFLVLNGAFCLIYFSEELPWRRRVQWGHRDCLPFNGLEAFSADVDDWLLVHEWWGGER